MDSGLIQLISNQAGMGGLAIFAIWMVIKIMEMRVSEARQSAEEHRASNMQMMAVVEKSTAALEKSTAALQDNAAATADLRRAIEHLTRIQPAQPRSSQTRRKSEVPE